MTNQRIYCPQDMAEGGRYHLGRDHLRYLRKVLRITVGDHLILFDGAGNEYGSVVRQLDDRDAVVEIVEKESRAVDQASHDVILLQALPKGSKMDLIVQKATELGVARITPFVSERSVPKLSREKGLAKVARWRKIALEATRQSGRPSVPEIGEILSFDEALRSRDGTGATIIFWEEEKMTSCRELLKDDRLREAKDMAIVIGPEGGFSPEEVARARAKGFESASIGSNILKVDTAAIAALTIIQYERGFFDLKVRQGGLRNGI